MRNARSAKENMKDCVESIQNSRKYITANLNYILKICFKQVPIYQNNSFRMKISLRNTRRLNCNFQMTIFRSETSKDK